MQTITPIDDANPFTVPSDGIFTLVGEPTTGTATPIIRMTIKRNGATLKFGNGSNLGVPASVTQPVFKDDIVGADYAYQASLIGYFTPLE